MAFPHSEASGISPTSTSEVTHRKPQTSTSTSSSITDLKPVASSQDCDHDTPDAITRHPRTKSDIEAMDNTPKQLHGNKMKPLHYQLLSSRGAPEPTPEEQAKTWPLVYYAAQTYRRISDIATKPAVVPRENPVKVVCVSDTHGLASQATRKHLLQGDYLPDGDILIHAGDISKHGTRQEVEATLDWLKRQKFKVKILIPGNHDKVMDPVWTRQSEEYQNGSITDDDLNWAQNIDWNSYAIIYLRHNSTTITVKGRKFNVFGSPMTPKFKNWPFQYSYDEVGDIWRDVPSNTDILITHGPPKGHMDTGWGCSKLVNVLWRVKPRLHIFGHVHEGHGHELLRFDLAQWAYDGILTNPENANWRHRAVLYLTSKLASFWPWPFLSTAKTTLVNAAIETGFFDKDIQEPIVLWI